MKLWTSLALSAVSLGSVSVGYSVPTIVIATDQPGAPISKAFQGIFFEDINFGADGGLSAELIKNGSFEFEDPIFGWSKKELKGTVGGYGVREDHPAFPKNPHYARITLQTPGEGFRLRNEGYRAMSFTAGAKYRFSVYVRTADAQPASLRIELTGKDEKVLGTSTVSIDSAEWKRVEAEITASDSEPKGSLTLVISGASAIDLDAVSLMPVETWKHRANGLRADIVQELADLKPGFIRFPGGCIVEGRTLANRYQWKDTIGPVENRKQIYNRWNVEFASRGKGAADYYQSFRVGFLEYFLLCEDLGATPVPIINCGMACQFNSGELAPLSDLAPYIQDALDLIEFANGPITTTWGAKRAELGHPEPFGMKFLGIGNEQWGPQYYERYKAMAEAVRASHPEIKLIFSAGPFPQDDLFRTAWKAIPELPVDVVDEHSYAKPEWFFDNATRYDAQDRSGPKIFMGEYAAHVESQKNTWEAALAEAAFLTGLERNADIVEMSSYAPLLAHVDAAQWAPNLIWFNNTQSYGTANYQVQKLFALNRGDTVVPVKVENPPLAASGKPRLFASATQDKATGTLVLKVVNATADEQSVALQIPSSFQGTKVKRTVLSSPSLADENTFAQPDKIAPREQNGVELHGNQPTSFPAYSITILRISRTM